MLPYIRQRFPLARKEQDNSMAILAIRHLPDTVLRKKAKRVPAIDKSIQRLIDNLLETLHASPGRVGLAAPQVGVSLRVVVISLPDQKDMVLINPKIVRRKGERLVNEGCLSFPGYAGRIKRSESVTVKGLDRQGKPIRIKGEELLAQALEHELDHLNGTLYIDHVEDEGDLFKVEPEVVEFEQETENDENLSSK